MRLWMGILEEGLTINKEGKFVYNPRSIDIRKIQKRLSGDISPNYLGIPLESLIDDDLVEARWPERIRDQNGDWIWTRTYRIHPDIHEKALLVFNALHNISKN